MSVHVYATSLCVCSCARMCGALVGGLACRLAQRRYRASAVRRRGTAVTPQKRKKRKKRDDSYFPSQQAGGAEGVQVVQVIAGSAEVGGAQAAI